MRSPTIHTALAMAVAGLLLLATGPSLALNPQPEPPGRSAKVKNGKLNPANKAEKLKAGKRQKLPPGPCKQGAANAC